jgi:hypothetical protein
VRELRSRLDVRGDPFDPLKAAIEERGGHAITGMTVPYMELVVWAAEEDRQYDVALPEGPVAVHVRLLDDFTTLGWLGFATCDRHYSGGWAESDRLYCVRDAYDLESEEFAVSYLLHEGQHFADYERFPGLPQEDLEYRAKLAELARAEATLRDLVTWFAANRAAEGPPHSRANHRVIRDLGEALGVGEPPWDAVSDADLRAAAERLLRADAASRSP